MSSDSTNVIFESCDLRHSAPSTVSRATVVYCGPGTTNWSAMYHTWKQTASTKWLLTSIGYVSNIKLYNRLISQGEKENWKDKLIAIQTEIF